MLDVHNDWKLASDGDLEFVQGSSAAGQRLFIRLGTQQGEYRWDLAIGVSWLYSILGQRGDSAAVRQLLVDQIRQDPEVAAVGDIQATFNNSQRKIAYTISVRLIDGVNTTLSI